MNLLSVLRSIERYVLVGIFLVMVTLYFANVALREFGGTLVSDFGWIEEFVRTLNLYLVFLAAGLALERGRQVGVHTWRDGISARTGIPLRRIVDAVGFVFALAMIWLSWEMTQFVIGTGQQSPTLGISAAWIYVAPLVGFALLGLRFALSLFGVIDRFSVQEEIEG